MSDNKFVMRIKNILSLIAFSAAFIFSVTLIGLPKDNFYSRLAQASSFRQNRKNIRTLLQQDDRNGMLRSRAIINLDETGSNSSFDVASYADATGDYVDLSQSIDDSDLPADFQAAWREHMNAWRDQSEYLNRLKASNRKYNVDGRETNQFSLNPNDGQTYSSNVDKINSTWFEVLRLGRKYGVDTSRY